MAINAKSPEQHLADAKAMSVSGIEVIGPAKQFNGSEWFVNVRCLNCGKQKWIRKNALKKTTHCGCLNLRKRKDKEMKETPKMDTSTVELTDAQKKEIDTLLEKEETVTVPRRFVVSIAEQLKESWGLVDFYKLSPKEFNQLVTETIEVYEALNGGWR